MSDPHRPPSAEEVQASGVGDWVDQALSEKRRRDRELSGLLGDPESERARRRAGLEALLTPPPSTLEPEAPTPPEAPDLFAREREAQRQARQRLAGFAEEERLRKERERDALRDLFS